MSWEKRGLEWVLAWPILYRAELKLELWKKIHSKKYVSIIVLPVSHNHSAYFQLSYPTGPNCLKEFCQLPLAQLTVYTKRTMCHVPWSCGRWNKHKHERSCSWQPSNFLLFLKSIGKWINEAWSTFASLNIYPVILSNPGKELIYISINTEFTY